MRNHGPDAEKSEALGRVLQLQATMRSASLDAVLLLQNAAGSAACLKAGMVIALEPKFFFSGRRGGGVENDYLITETGFEKLSDFPEQIIFSIGEPWRSRQVFANVW